jgi:hypothetical protein
MATPRSIRFDPDVLKRLRHAAGRHEGASVSAMVNRYVDEAMRMEEHPGVFFRSGPSGRRAVLIGGPDVWEVIRAIKNVRNADPSLTADDVVDAVSESSGLPAGKISIAVRYWSAFSNEIDAWIDAADADEAAAEERFRRERDLLTS